MCGRRASGEVLSNERVVITDSVSLLATSLFTDFFVIKLWNNMFLRTFPFHLDYSICWHKDVPSTRIILLFLYNW